MDRAPRQFVAEGMKRLEPPRQAIDREKVLAILHKRFPSATPEQLAAAANAIVGLKQDDQA